MSHAIPLKKKHVLVLEALWKKKRSREEIDHIASASNGPEVIAQLRRHGLSIPCRRISSFNSNGERVRYGEYSLSAEDREAILRLFVKQELPW